jgi:hypothetical protein
LYRLAYIISLAFGWVYGFAQPGLNQGLNHMVLTRPGLNLPTLNSTDNYPHRKEKLDRNYIERRPRNLIEKSAE